MLISELETINLNLMFDQKTKIGLQYYVYVLINPMDQRPFYIGKGIENRVFDHLKMALTDLDSKTAKYEIIRMIESSGRSVKHLIIKHGLTQNEAYIVESAVIDILKNIGFELSNLVNGHKSIEKGIMTTDEITRLYNAEPLNTISPESVIININKKYLRNSSSNSIYEDTKGIWAINIDRLIEKDSGKLKIRYVLSEYKGLIIEVFEVEKWYQEERQYNSNSQKFGELRLGMSFLGKVATENIRSLYLNKSIAHHKKKGAASAHRFNL